MCAERKGNSLDTHRGKQRQREERASSTHMDQHCAIGVRRVASAASTGEIPAIARRTAEQQSGSDEDPDDDGTQRGELPAALSLRRALLCSESAPACLLLTGGEQLENHGEGTREMEECVSEGRREASEDARKQGRESGT